MHCHGGKRPFSFCVRIVFPSTSGSVPAIIHGDGCWWNQPNNVAQRVMDSGCALVMFNRTEMAEDLGYPDVPDKAERSGGLYDIYPDERFGALSAWAWGYNRCVDLLHMLPFINKDRIAVTGHSHAPEDWDVLLDFIAWKWLGKNPKAAYNNHPCEHLKPAFSWRAPNG